MRKLLLPALAVVVGCQAVALAQPPAPTAAPPFSVAASQDGGPALLPAPRQEGGGDAPPPPPCTRPPLTLAELEQLALAHNPTIPQAASLVQQQEGLTTQAGLYPNPTVGYLRSDPDQPGQSRTAGVFLSQDLVTAGKLRLARAAGRQEVDFRTWQLHAQQVRVLNDVRTRYYEVLGAQQAVQAATELVRLAEEGVRAAQKLLQSRQGTRPDVLQAEIQLSLVRGSLQDAQFRHTAAWQQLTSFLGVPDLPPTPLAGSVEEQLPTLEWQESVQQLLSESPLLKAQEAEVRASQYELRLARVQAVPNVNVQVVAERDSVQKFSSVSTLVSVPVPIFNRNQGNIVNAAGVLQQQQQEYQRLRLALTDQLAASFRQYLTLRAQAERLRAEVLPRSRENLELTTQAYRLGRFDFLRVLNARQTHFQAQLAYIDALTELHKTVVEIQGFQLTGGLNPTEVGTALQTTPGAGGGGGARGVLLQQLQEQRGAAMRSLPGAVQGGEK